LGKNKTGSSKVAKPKTDFFSNIDGFLKISTLIKPGFDEKPTTGFQKLRKPKTGTPGLKPKESNPISRQHRRLVAC
jgi:hypothetical protein